MANMSERIAQRFTEASDEVQLTALPPGHQALLKKLGFPVIHIWDGVHGVIAELKLPRNKRFDKGDLVEVSSNPLFRWMSFNDGDMQLGLTQTPGW